MHLRGTAYQGEDQCMSAHAVVIQEQIRVPMDIDTLEKFRRWAISPNFPKKGISYFGGDIDVEMSPAELNNNKVSGEIYRELKTIDNVEDLGELFHETVLLSNVAADLSTYPDILFVSHETLESGRVQFVESSSIPGQWVEVIGSPDMVTEVVSRTSVRKDTVILRDLYYRAGIREYWLADIRREKLEFRILQRGPADWTEPEESGGWQRSDVFQRHFRLSCSHGRAGQPRFRFESR